MARRLSGHRLTVEWNGERGDESASTGTCPCGWTESGSTRAVVRQEYRWHLEAVANRKRVLIDHLQARHRRLSRRGTLHQLALRHARDHHRYRTAHFHEGVNLGAGNRPAGWRTGEGVVDR